MTEVLDYERVRQYWEEAGKFGRFAAYGAHRAGLPDGSIRYRFGRERAVVNGWMAHLPRESSVLDAGCGAGLWLEEFAARYARVVAIELSSTMFETARARLAHKDNVTLIQGHVLEVEVQGPFDAIFLGGLLMYLSRDDAVSYLRRLEALLGPGGIIIARETTVRRKIDVREGDYPVAYRPVAEIRAIVADSGLAAEEVQPNEGYNHMAVGWSLSWLLRQLPPFRWLKSSIVGVPLWWFLRGTSLISLRFIPWLLDRLRIQWPYLQNHFMLISRRRGGRD